MKLFCLCIFFISFCVYSQLEFNSKKINELIILLTNDSINKNYTSKEKHFLAQELLIEAKKQNDIQAQLIGTEYLSNSYLNMGNLDKFYNLSEKGLILSLKHKNTLFKNKFLLNIGKFYQDVGKINESDSIFMLVVKDITKIKDITENNLGIVSEAFLYLSINQLFCKDNNEGLMKYYEFKSIEYAEKIKKDYILRNKRKLNAYSKRISNMMNSGDLKESYELLKTVDSISLAFPDKTYRISPLMQYGYYFYLTNNFEKAITFFEEAEKTSLETNFLSSLPGIYDGFYQCYKKMNSLENAIFYLEKMEQIGDTIHKMERAALIKSTKSKELHAINETNTSSWIYLIPIVLLLSLTGVIYYKKSSKKIDKTDIEEEKGVDNEVDVTDSLNKHAEKLQELYRIAIEDNEVFFNLYIKAFPDFHESMKKLGLTNSEIEICAMTKLSIDTKQIARIKNLTVRSVESKKYRIRKKLNLSPTDELASWLLLNS